MQRHLKSIVQQIRLRPRLLSAFVIGCVIATLFPSQFSGVTRTLIAWDAGVALYLILALIMFINATPKHMRARALSQDDGALLVLTLTVVAALATVAAIIVELSGVKAFDASLKYWHLALGLITLISSWAFIHTSFALHYAHDYYTSLRKYTQAPLTFPEQTEPDYWDFLYFSFVIGMTSQTSDVAIAATRMRRLVVFHGIIAFFFNTTLLALAINTAANTL